MFSKTPRPPIDTGKNDQNKRNRKREIKATRDAEVIALHQQGKSLRKIHAEIGESLGISYGTVVGIVKAYKSGHPLYSNLIERCPELYTPQNPDPPCVDSETLHTQEPSVNPQASVPPPNTLYRVFTPQSRNSETGTGAVPRTK